MRAALSVFGFVAMLGWGLLMLIAWLSPAAGHDPADPLPWPGQALLFWSPNPNHPTGASL
jgi:uncharacterized membrane protein YedE/YeeE